MIVFALGASRNIGYFATLKLLAKGATVVYLLRSPATLENDDAFKPYLESGKAKFVQGDAMNYEDVVKAWRIAVAEGPVDLLLFTIGATSGRLHLTKGVIISPHNLCSVSIVNAMRAVLETDSNPTPKLLVVSSTGITPQSKAVLPWLLRPMYWYLLRVTFVDKRGMEAVLHHAIGKPYEEGQTPEDHLPAGWRDQIPQGSFARNAHGGGGGGVVLRVAGLTNGEEQGKYRAQVGDFSTYTISRRDVGLFIAEEMLDDWTKFEGGVVTVGY